jgi:hypothetical protein
LCQRPPENSSRPLLIRSIKTALPPPPSAFGGGGASLLVPGGVVGKNARSESERPSETARGMPNRTLHVSNGKKNANAAQVSTLPLQYLTRVGELYSNSGHGKDVCSRAPMRWGAATFSAGDTSRLQICSVASCSMRHSRLFSLSTVPQHRAKRQRATILITHHACQSPCIHRLAHSQKLKHLVAALSICSMHAVQCSVSAHCPSCTV